MRKSDGADFSGVAYQPSASISSQYGVCENTIISLSAKANLAKRKIWQLMAMAWQLMKETAGNQWRKA